MYFSCLNKSFLNIRNTSAQWESSAGDPVTEGETPHTDIFKQMLVKEAWLDNLNWILDDADWWLMLFVIVVIGCCYKETFCPAWLPQTKYV